ncbi:hypothetical protein DL93DRAFT_2030328, partial [Clavulina sp. PMI_390]
LLWLQGMAGAGKSSIAVSLAKYLEEANVCMAYYGFERAKSTQLHPANLFTTIALQLAAKNSALEAQLLGLVEMKRSMCRHTDPREQFNEFLLPLLGKDSATLNHLVIIIDALDESSDKVSERKGIVDLLSGVSPSLPTTVHILITTRPEVDIQEAIQALMSFENASTLSMGDLVNKCTKDDISLYIRSKLQHVTGDADPTRLDQLAGKAQLSFQWAATACGYIVDLDDGNQSNSPSERLDEILSGSDNTEGLEGLYEIYRRVMDKWFHKSTQDNLKLLKLLLGLLSIARIPLSLPGMLELLHAKLLQDWDIHKVRQKAVYQLRFLSSLISGTGEKAGNVPLLPMHTSFLDFLQSQTRSSQYWIDAGAMHSLICQSCLTVMQEGQRRLKFNICGLQSSFLPNSQIPEL